ncbi:hypothetical protein [Kamptonema sp. UHCC 0994]|uniref:hypothetical protein n=1 Tax=Kamptonema sp. UHCC 0994 TaxID=3031329 RepID=UPI0023B9077D|nr:hypothetical protein [Kamptonema sp. UHCC 0994]MDF0553644.1 hypothetical protein [Kamptonema sp. UHCC 0994]
MSREKLTQEARSLLSEGRGDRLSPSPKSDRVELETGFLHKISVYGKGDLKNPVSFIWAKGDRS